VLDTNWINILDSYQLHPPTLESVGVGHKLLCRQCDAVWLIWNILVPFPVYDILDL
jgi:hypothetical protein